MTYPVTLVPGDSTGPENCKAVRSVLEATGVDFDWDEQPAPGGEITPELVDSARRTGTVLMGHQYGKRDQGIPAPIVQLRRKLGLFAAVRPAQSVLALNDRFPDVDLAILRETTEDVYASMEHETIPGVFESLKVTTREACERIARFAFEYARRYDRQKVTVVHKANILKKADGLFLRTAQAVASEYPDIEHEDVIVDALCMKLALHPERFDLLLCGNLFGDILGDLAAGLVGGKSNCPSINLGRDGLGVFTTGHGDPPQHVGTGQGNPLSLMFSGIFLLRHLGEQGAADRLNTAIHATLDAGSKPVAAGGEATCQQLAEAVASHLAG